METQLSSSMNMHVTIDVLAAMRVQQGLTLFKPGLVRRLLRQFEDNLP